MKLIGLMSLEGDKDQIRAVLERNHVHIYSELDIVGHTADTLRQYGWWPSTGASKNIYSTLYFTIVAEELAAAVLGEIENMPRRAESGHPPRAFQVNIEKMV